MFNRLCSLSFLLIASLSFFSGCGEAPLPKGTVSGIIEFKKAPTTELDLIVFAPATGNAVSCNIKDGQFAFPEPILTGEYVAYLAPRAKPEAQEAFAVTLDTSVPDEYYNETTTPLKFKIDQGPNKVSFVVE
ncbi:carboxypeptidase regulatory-like domain-containing protein [bacterium]|nr:hypothetical protein [Planctomicrobium sp.]MBT5018890.1 carboxypeptidase regulatory-like domain-containing protein [Planctomicrobium sp.]MDA7504209.1 carboxypeptidase regulatory-like domain-containing protein [bacterium]